MGTVGPVMVVAAVAVEVVVVAVGQAIVDAVGGGWPLHMDLTAFHDAAVVVVGLLHDHNPPNI